MLKDFAEILRVDLVRPNGWIDGFGNCHIQWEDWAKLGNITHKNMATLQGMDTYPTKREKENHLQNAIFEGYVSSLEAKSCDYLLQELKLHHKLP